MFIVIQPHIFLMVVIRKIQMVKMGILKNNQRVDYNFVKKMGAKCAVLKAVIDFLLVA